jgi:hypothetical protein
MNDDWERPATMTGRWHAGGIGQPPPSDGSGDEDDTSIPMGSKRGRGILTPPERVDVGQIHQWCLIKATQLEMESASLIQRKTYYLNNGEAYSDQFITYQNHARPFILAEAEENFEKGRSILLLGNDEAYMLQELRGALHNPQLMSSLERRVLVAQFPELKERTEWRIYVPQPTIRPLLTEEQRSRREIGFELDDWVVRVKDTRNFGVIVDIRCSPPAGGYVLELDEEHIERIYEHVQWVKEGRRGPKA